jgi:hypothetical protein
MLLYGISIGVAYLVQPASRPAEVTPGEESSV